jgi:hypothetical protein
MGGEFAIDTDFVHWFKGYGPIALGGPCSHDCKHRSMSNIAWGPDKAHYTLNECNDCGCRAWDAVYLPDGSLKPKSLRPQSDLDWMEPLAQQGEPG